MKMYKDEKISSEDDFIGRNICQCQILQVFDLNTTRKDGKKYTKRRIRKFRQCTP